MSQESEDSIQDFVSQIPEYVITYARLERHCKRHKSLKNAIDAINQLLIGMSSWHASAEMRSIPQNKANQDKAQQSLRFSGRNDELEAFWFDQLPARVFLDRMGYAHLWFKIRDVAIVSGEKLGYFPSSGSQSECKENVLRVEQLRILLNDQNCLVCVNQVELSALKSMIQVLLLRIESI